MPEVNTVPRRTVRRRQYSTYVHIKLSNFFKMKKKIDSYFSRVTANRHACNMYVGGKTFDLKFQAEKEVKENRQREIDDRVKERREAAKRMRPIERTAEQNACMRTACMMSSHTT